MKKLLLLVLTIIIVNLVHSKTLPHAMTNKATQRRAQVTEILDKTITRNIVRIGDKDFPAIELGMAVDLTSMNTESEDMIRHCFLKKYIADNKVVTSHRQTDSGTAMVSAKSDKFTKLFGSAELAFDVEIASITGKAELDYEDSTKKANQKWIVNEIHQDTYESLNFEKVTEDDLQCDENQHFTHVVAKVTMGKTFYAEVTLESKTQDNTVAARGDLRVKFMELPIGGKAEANFNYTNKTEGQNFTAIIHSTGGLPVQTPSSLKQYVDIKQDWFDKILKSSGKENVVISYELHPISHFKQFGNRKVQRTAQEQMMFSRAVPIYNQMNVLSAAMKKLKEVVPSSESSTFTKKYNVLSDKLVALKLAVKDNEIKQNLLDNYAHDTVAIFTDTDYFKDLLSKIKANKKEVRNGKYYLLFDDKYLTGNKALWIEYKAGGGNCRRRRQLTHRLAENKKRKLQEWPFVCRIEGGNSFDNKMPTIDTKFCVLSNGNLLGKEEIWDIKNQYHNENNRTWIHVSYIKRISTTHFIPTWMPIPAIPIPTWKTHNCAYDQLAQTEYKDSDLPWFHLTQNPINQMKYNQIAKKDKEESWEITEVNVDKKYFSIKNVARLGRVLCMYPYKGYNSLVIDLVPDISKREDCQWYKEDKYLYNAMSRQCISRTGDIGKMDKDSIQLQGISHDGMLCASYKEEVTMDRLRRRLVKKSGTS